MTFSTAALASGEVLVPRAPSPRLRATVVIPVKDEAEHLPATLASLLRQTDPAGQPLDPRTYEIIVLANNCRDASADVVRRWAHRAPHAVLHVAEAELPPAVAHVGTARRMLMDEAACRLKSVGQPRGVIATTDGDTEVSGTWLWWTMEEIRRGADAVGGRILIRPEDLSPQERCYHLRDVGYRFLQDRLETLLYPEEADPWPRHYQSFGGSLAVTAGAYERVGGLPALPALEDVELVQALRRHDARLRRSPQVRVRTSGRRVGRTCWGMAAQLRTWGEMSAREQPFLVESAEALRTHFNGRYWLRAWWRYLHGGAARPRVPFVRVARGLCQPPDELLATMMEATTFGAVWVPLYDAPAASDAWRTRYPRVDIRQATADLRLMLQTRLSTSSR
ncbi:MAG: glycosyltransferase family A protein [Catalinimonas sp.]